MNRLRKFPIWCFGVLGVAGSVFFFALQWSATREFWGLGGVGSVILWLPLLLVTVLGVSAIFLVLGWFAAWYKLTAKTQWLLLLSPWILVTLFWFGVAKVIAEPRHRFRTLVLDPVPAGVHDVHARGFNAFLASRWLVQFETEAKDLQNIVSRHELAEVEPFDLPAMLRQDVFLSRLEGMDPIPVTKPARFFKRKSRQGQADKALFLVYDPATTQAWFVQSSQN